MQAAQQQSGLILQSCEAYISRGRKGKGSIGHLKDWTTAEMQVARMRDGRKRNSDVILSSKAHTHVLAQSQSRRTCDAKLFPLDKGSRLPWFCGVVENVKRRR